MIRTRTLVVLWAIVVLEILSPLPMLLSLGAAYVLLFRPPWFRKLVLDLYH